MKITLIRPRSIHSKPHPLANTRPLGFHIIASVLENCGFNVDILDLQLERNNKINSPEGLILNTNSQIYGISALTATRFEAVEIARYIKRLRPSSTIVVGGPHFMHCAKETLERVKDIDIVVKGPGLQAIVEVAKAIEKKADLNDIPSITYRRNGNVVENPVSENFKIIDNLPIYTKFSLDDYSENLRHYPERIKSISLIASQGCAGQCVFCSKYVEGYHPRDSSRVVEEISCLKKTFNVSAFNFVDMSFTCSSNHVRAICDGLRSKNIKIKWWCESRVDVPLDILTMMKEAGCVSLAVGIESGSDRILSKISKRITVDTIERFCRTCNNIGLYAELFFMYSHPDETLDDVKMTLKLMKNLQRFPLIDVLSFQPTMIFPGSRLETIAKARNILPKDFSWYEPYDSELNRRLRQIANIPLFIDLLTSDQMVRIFEESIIQNKVIGKIKAFFRKHTPGIYLILKKRLTFLRQY